MSSPTVPLAGQDRFDCGLYVHIPFCDSKCGYCDFYSVAVEGRDTGGLVDRVIRELGRRVGPAARRVRTVFFGGGTPTILPMQQLADVLRAVGELVDVSALEEFTVEANPATVDDGKARQLIDGGVTRVSMGAQSFLESELAALERLHSPADIAPSAATLRRAGFRRINLDLIFGIPGQTMETWSRSLHRAIDLGVEHIACYGLTYEPNTKLTAMKHHGRITPCDENLEAEMYLYAIDVLAAGGYGQYEISNFAKQGEQSQHNLIYWRNEPYIGVGPSAVGCIDGRRYKNVPDINAYIRAIDRSGHAEIESEQITPEMLILEIILMQLRLNEGLSVAKFRERCGADPQIIFEPALTRLVDRGLATSSETAIALTRTGRLVANDVMAELAAACDRSPRRVHRDRPLPIAVS